MKTRRLPLVLPVLIVLTVLSPNAAFGHGVSVRDDGFVQSIDGVAVRPHGFGLANKLREFALPQAAHRLSDDTVISVGVAPTCGSQAQAVEGENV